MKKLAHLISRLKPYYPLLILTALPLLANIILILGIYSCDPESIYGNLLISVRRGPMPGSACFVDPSVAYLTQPLGYLSAQDWLHFTVPWWNPYNGIGMPLAAEMQNESFFLPFVLLLHFHNGWLLQRLLFQILCGQFTYVFLRRLNLGTQAAILGGVLFSLNGMFYLAAGTVTAPFFCLPLLLIGIEDSFVAAAARRPMGWSLIVLGLAGSIYAGYPEMAYFDGLLAGAWALLRLAMAGPARWHLLGKLALSGTIGLALTAPLVWPFLQYLMLGEAPGHNAFFGNSIRPATAAPLAMLPMFYGDLASPASPSLHDAFGDMWIRIGGWFGCAPVLLALYALQRRSPQRYFLAAWVLLWEARYFGFPGVIALLNHIPGIALTDAIRYADVSVMFALFTLAAYGLDDLYKHPQARLLWPLTLFLLCLCLSIIPAWPYIKPWFADYPRLRSLQSAYLLGVLGINLVLVLAMRRRRNYVPAAQALIIGGAVLLFCSTTLGGMRRIHIEHAGIAFLQKNLGQYRFYSLGPFAPNYNAEYGLASINYVQIPTPTLWTNYILSSLFPYAGTIVFGGHQNHQPFALRAYLKNYQAIGVKYVIADISADALYETVFSPTAQQSTTYSTLGSGQSLSGVIVPPSMAPQGLSATPIEAVTIHIGTFFGHSSGILTAQICARNQCVSGQADLATAADNSAFAIPLEKPIWILATQPILYKFTHVSGAPVAIWLAPVIGPSQSLAAPNAPKNQLAPQLGFRRASTTKQPPVVFQDQTMDIYQLPNPAPYAEITAGTCQLQTFGRQHFVTDCTTPSKLLRREMFYPGWYAIVNGKRTEITQSGLFQTLNLPAGHSTIKFVYVPSYILPCCLIALLALLVWAAKGASPPLDPPRGLRPSTPLGPEAPDPQ